MKIRTSALILLLPIVACTASPPMTLEERLAGKSPEERKRILRVACLNEAEDLGNSDRDIRTPHGVKVNAESAETHRLKDICRKISDEYPAVTAE